MEWVLKSDRGYWNETRRCWVLEKEDATRFNHGDKAHITVSCGDELPYWEPADYIKAINMNTGEVIEGPHDAVASVIGVWLSHTSFGKIIIEEGSQ